jgi:hypothetical protein
MPCSFLYWILYVGKVSGVLCMARHGFDEERCFAQRAASSYQAVISEFHCC